MTTAAAASLGLPLSPGQHTIEDRRTVHVECPLNTELVALGRRGEEFRPVHIAVDWSTQRIDIYRRHAPAYTVTGPIILRNGREGRTISHTFASIDAVPQWIRDITENLRPHWAIQ